MNDTDATRIWTRTVNSNLLDVSDKFRLRNDRFVQASWRAP